MLCAGWVSNPKPAMRTLQPFPKWIAAQDGTIIIRRAKAGEPFTVEVSVGENLHIMSPAHWIEYIELNIGNEPAGRIDLQPKGYLKPKASFTVMLPADAAPTGKVTLIARQRCNLHGLWEGTLDITVT